VRLAEALKRRLTKLLVHTAAQRPSSVGSAHSAVNGYLALSRCRGLPQTLDERVGLLARNLAADLSGCQWCIDRSRHECRSAGIPRELLERPRHYRASPLLISRERAALAFVEAASAASAAPIDASVLDDTRCFFSEYELAELTAIVAGHHLLESTANLYHPGS
jgi:alkylhydroperoxidase family enzyme